MKRGERLPDSELEVMQAVWDCAAPVQRAEIERALSARRALAPTTILTLLTRLTEKGYLEAEKQGRSNCYTPLISRREYLARESRSFVDKLCSGSMSTFAAALCDSGLSRADIEELRALLEEDKI